jgi:hypothetical protein
METVADFELWLGPAADAAGAYPVQVRSPAGPAAGALQLPLKDKDFQDRLAGVGGEGPDLAQRQDFGKCLFARLFKAEPAQEVGRVWHESRGRLGEGRFGTLRLRLWIEAPEISVLPWELLWDGDFLATSANITVSRYLPAAEPDVLPPAERLRVLLLVESPDGFTAIHEEEVRSLEDAITGLGRAVDLVRKTNLTAPQLQGDLQDDYHVLHVLAHGIRGKLLLADARGRGAAIEDQELAQMVLGRRSLRLIVLSACSSSQVEGGGLFAGIGPALVRKRVPAVVAMQYPAVTQGAAGQFSGAFYGALSRGKPVDVAVNEGRRSLSAGPLLAGRDWSTPVLYLGTRSSLLFDFWQKPAGGPGQPLRPLRAVVQGDEAAQQALLALGTVLADVRARLRRLRLLAEVRDALDRLRAGFARCREAVERSVGNVSRIDGAAVQDDWDRLCEVPWLELMRWADELADVPAVAERAAQLRAAVEGLREVFENRAMVLFARRVLDFDRLLPAAAAEFRRLSAAAIDEADAVANQAASQLAFGVASSGPVAGK